jgi:hypothetical protein
MTQAVARILAEVERLSPPERTDLRRALMERVPMSEEALTEEDFSALAAESFRGLDAEEAAYDAARRHAAES